MYKIAWSSSCLSCVCFQFFSGCPHVCPKERQSIAKERQSIPHSYPCLTHVLPISYPCLTHVLPISYACLSQSSLPKHTQSIPKATPTNPQSSPQLLPKAVPKHTQSYLREQSRLFWFVLVRFRSLVSLYAAPLPLAIYQAQ